MLHRKSVQMQLPRQDLPVSVTAISEKLIIDSDSLDSIDIGRMVPNATLHPSATFAGTPNFNQRDWRKWHNKIT